MTFDHSLTYTDKKLKNLPHRNRLRNIFSILDQLNFNREKYCDIGCSNGYITDLINKKYTPNQTVGFDHNLENLNIAKNNYSNIEFLRIDLNIFTKHNKKFDLITCFETLEHVGNIENAIKNLLNFAKNGTIILVSVPIEVGLRGLLKFLIKTLVFGYSLDEINKNGIKYFYWKYLFCLLTNKDISRYRSSHVSGYGTHFGFNYKVIDKTLRKKRINYFLKVKGTTAFYIIKI